MNDQRTIGQIVDDLGCELGETLNESDLFASAVVILKAVTTDGDERLVTMRSESLGFCEMLGMLTIAIDDRRIGQYLNGED
jgi:hypothetical protein